MTMRRDARRKVLVIGLGNRDRGDDGVGVLVARSLDGRLPPDVAIAARSGDVLSMIADWTDFEAVICVDAAAPMTEPGRIHRVDPASGALPPQIGLTSSHAFGLSEAIGLARTLHMAPREIIIYAVEGACFDAGAPMTPAVVAAVSTAADCIVAEVGRLRCEGK